MIREVSAFYFEWPAAFWTFLLIPLWWWGYLRTERRHWQNTLRFSRAAMVARLKLEPSPTRRLRYPLLVSALAVCLIAALARPTVVGQIPVQSVDMMIVLDISLSMMADDIPPNRITAAKETAASFIESLPRDTRIGLTFFAGDTYVMSPPTRNHREVAAYLKNLQVSDLKTRTEIGSAMRTVMDVMIPQMEQERVTQPERVMILLSDGDSQEGYPWAMAAEDAREANITVHTVGVGREAVTSIVYQGMELPVLFSETTLRRIAEITEGQYFRVLDEADFRKVYDHIRERSMHYEERAVDVGFALAGLALVLLLAGSLMRHRL